MTIVLTLGTFPEARKTVSTLNQETVFTAHPAPNADLVQQCPALWSTRQNSLNQPQDRRHDTPAFAVERFGVAEEVGEGLLRVELGQGECGVGFERVHKGCCLFL
jgi:hypothetical protein